MFLAGKLPMAAAFNMPSTSITARMLKADLAAANIPYADDQGRVGDFHSLRHTCGTWLAASGAHSKVIQSIMRHSTITLTMDTYGHRLMEKESQALAKLPDLSLPPDSQSLPANGTHDAPMDENVLARCWAREGIETKNSTESGGALATRCQDEEKPLPMRESGDSQGESTDWRRWESNPHLHIANART